MEAPRGYICLGGISVPAGSYSTIKEKAVCAFAVVISACPSTVIAPPWVIGRHFSKCWHGGEVSTLGCYDPIATVRAIQVLAPNEKAVV